MKIQPGATTPTVVKQGCGNVCHTASADGSTLVANTALRGAERELRPQEQRRARSRRRATRPSRTAASTRTARFLDVRRRTTARGPAARRSSTTRRRARTIAAPGWDGVITNGGTPAFSPDGKQIAFRPRGQGQRPHARGHELRRRDARRSRVSPTSRPTRAATSGGPRSRPTRKSVVYHAGSNAAFETDNDATGDVYAVDLATQHGHAPRRARRLQAPARARTCPPTIRT